PPPLLPYTTLFRSLRSGFRDPRHPVLRPQGPCPGPLLPADVRRVAADDPRRSTPGSDDRRRRQIRQHLKSTSRQRRCAEATVHAQWPRASTLVSAEASALRSGLGAPALSRGRPCRAAAASATDQARGLRPKTMPVVTMATARTKCSQLSAVLSGTKLPIDSIGTTSP